MALHFNGKHYMFTRFFLEEPVVPVKTLYGTNEDVNNMEIFNYMEHYYTFIKCEKFYKIDVEKDTGKINFGFGDVLVLEHEDYIITRKDNYKTKSYSNSCYYTEQPKMNFNKLFYVALEVVKEIKLPFFKLWSHDQSFACLYDFLTRNELFQEYLKKNYFNYDRFENDYYIYEMSKVNNV